MTFEEWLNELEGFASRSERLFADVDFEAVMTGNASCRYMQKRMLVWLEAAYNVGVEAGKQTTQSIPWPAYLPEPLPPSVPGPTPQPVWPNIRSCSKCGINLDRVMGYVCSDMNCPTFMRVIC